MSYFMSTGYGPHAMSGFGLDVPYTKSSGQTGVAKVDVKSDGQCGSYLGVQQMLADLGYNPGAIDGAAGKGTGNALSAFAQSAGVQHSGYYPQKPVCDALITAWSQRSAPAPSGGMMSLLQQQTPTTTAAAPAAMTKFMPKAALQVLRPAAPAPVAGKLSTMTLALIGGAVLAAGALIYLATRKKTATANRSRRASPNYTCRGTPPAKHRRKIRAKYGRKARRSDFAYPACWAYPVYDSAHARAAAGRFTQFGHMLPPKVRGKVKRRIQAAQRQFGGRL